MRKTAPMLRGSGALGAGRGKASAGDSAGSPIEFSFSLIHLDCRMYTHRGGPQMRTNIDIDDSLMKQAMKASGTKTKKAAVEKALQLLISIQQQEGIR